MRLPVMPPVRPMLSRSVAAIPVAPEGSPGMLYEPKWDGFRAVVFKDGDEVEITSRATRPMTRYFPELVVAARAELPPRCVLDGEIVVARGLPGPGPPAEGLARLDFEALQERVHPANSRVVTLARAIPASFVAFDLLALGDESFVDAPFASRRERLVPEVGPGGSFHVTPATDDVEVARRWFDQFEGAGLDGVVAKPADVTYQQDARAMFKVKHERTADAVVAGYRTYKGHADAVGSLLLGLYATHSSTASPGTPLAAVGVSSAFPMARRRELMAELAPYVTGLDGHPWAPDRAGAGVRTPWDAGESRWGAGKDLSFVPLRPELVVEVRYESMEGDRLRHTAHFVNWRPDRGPASCTYGQLDRPIRFDLADILGLTSG